MLTRQERQEIAERAASFNKSDLRYTDIYKCLLGEYPHGNTSIEEDDKAILDRLIDLCDTSNMIELPLDKDGEVIHLGDMVTNVAEDKIYRVGGYEFKSGCCAVLLASDRSHIWTYSRPDVLAHKKPVTIASLAEHLRNILEAIEGIDDSAYIELSNLADNLEILGDSDD